ncbi:MAG: type I-U CRISPR-associated RAMP protein Csb1/Cas7u [Acidobacteria bacterium]|nr:type I-U CRISPR-associated RAMP protein Csb1/Cas7u [Acidobacteriota bacterium]
MQLDLQRLLSGVATDSFDDGIRIDTELEPLAGAGGSVKPAVYEGGKYQEDRRWASPEDSQATPVIVIDNVPSQANRLEAALKQHRDASAPVPEFLLDLSELSNLPAHLPRELSSLEFPHRNADAYLRDARLGGVDFIRTDLGQSIFGATAQTCGPLMAWFPQALLYGFWQSHLGKKRQNTKHARAWVSEIVGWQPGATETRTFGLKGDALNLNTDEQISSNAADRLDWGIGGQRVEGGKKDKLSETGHGQVPFMGADAAAAAVSFARVTQRATLSFAQLRRVSLGAGHSDAQDESARALLVALGLHAHILAFGRGFALRSGAELRPKETRTEWLGADGDERVDLGGPETTGTLLREALEHAKATGVPLDGWSAPAVVLTPKENLRKAIRSTWPDLDG